MVNDATPDTIINCKTRSLAYVDDYKTYKKSIYTAIQDDDEYGL